MQLSVRHNLRDVDRWTRDLQKQATYAAAVALTRTAVRGKGDVQDEIQRVFDRPTRWAVQGVMVAPATKAKLESKVWLKDGELSSVGIPADKFLRAQIFGGKRAHKRFERSLQITGHMPNGWYAVPAMAARLDAHGNVSAGQIIQILSQLRVTLVTGFTRNMSHDPKKKKAAIKKAGGQYFSLPKGRGKLPPGIYVVRDTAWGRSAPKPVFIFVRRVRYPKRLKFFEVVRQTVDRHFVSYYDQALGQAMRGIRQPGPPR